MRPSLDDVVAFAHDAEFFRSPPEPAADRVEITDFAVAGRYAGLQDVPLGVMIWSDLKTRLILEASGGPKDEEALVLSTARGVEQRISDEFLLAEQQLPDADISVEVAADFELLGRLSACRSREPLLGHVFGAYVDGWWPCGWVGDYPHGELAVYHPSVLSRPSTEELVGRMRELLAHGATRTAALLELSRQPDVRMEFFELKAIADAAAAP